MDKILKAADDILKICRVGDHWLCAERAEVVKILKQLVEEKFKSTNDVCEYCAKHGNGKCFGTQHFPKCFVGRTITSAADVVRNARF